MTDQSPPTTDRCRGRTAPSAPKKFGSCALGPGRSPRVVAEYGADLAIQKNSVAAMKRWPPRGICHRPWLETAKSRSTSVKPRRWGTGVPSQSAGPLQGVGEVIRSAGPLIAPGVDHRQTVPRLVAHQLPQLARRSFRAHSGEPGCRGPSSRARRAACAPGSLSLMAATEEVTKNPLRPGVQGRAQDPEGSISRTPRSGVRVIRILGGTAKRRAGR